MKAGILAGGLLLVALAPSLSAATVICNKPTAKYVSESGKINKFRGEVVCTVSSSADMRSIYTSLYNTVASGGELTDEQVLKTGSQEGIQFIYKENAVNDNNGHIQVTYKGTILSDTNSVAFVANHTAIDADGDTERTKGVKEEYTYKIDNGVVTATLVKIVDIKRPSIGTGIFQSRVIEALKGQMKITAGTHASFMDHL